MSQTFKFNRINEAIAPEKQYTKAPRLNNTNHASILPEAAFEIFMMTSPFSMRFVTVF